jgi:hypothetical protein
VNDGYEDTINEYFIFPIANVEKYKANTLFDELTRNDELVNDDTEEVDEEKSEFIDEKFSTWHRENKNGESNSTFLQFDWSRTKQSLMGGCPKRKMPTKHWPIQGSSGSQQNTISRNAGEETNQYGKSGEHPFGENKDVVR